MENNVSFGRRDYGFSPKVERIELLTICVSLLAVCFALPLLVQVMPLDSWLREGGDQLIMGSVVNCALIIAGVNFKSGSKTSAVVIIPSIAHVALFFILATPIFGLYMVPAIWLGNVVIVIAFRYLHTHKKWSFGLTAVLAVAVKTGIIFGIFSILVSTGIIPQIAAAGMTARMGINQILVAAIGCLAALVILKTLYPKKTEIRKLS